MNTIVQDVANIQQMLSEVLCTLGATVEPQDGLSAYELAVQSGEFTGTLEEYLESLHGEKGETGLTGYEEAVANGSFTGTYAEWLEFLKGPAGPPGTFNLIYNDIFEL